MRSEWRVGLGLSLLVVSGIAGACNEHALREPSSTLTTPSPRAPADSFRSVSLNVDGCIFRKDQGSLFMRLDLSGHIGGYLGPLDLAEPAEVRALDEQHQTVGNPGTLEATGGGPLSVGIDGLAAVPSSLAFEHLQVVARGTTSLAAANAQAFQGMTFTAPFGPHLGGSFQVASSTVDDGNLSLVIQNQPTFGGYAMLGSRTGSLTIDSHSIEAISPGIRPDTREDGEKYTASQTFTFKGMSGSQLDAPVQLTLGHWVALLRDPVLLHLSNDQCKVVLGGEPLPSSVPSLDLGT